MCFAFHHHLAILQYSVELTGYPIILQIDLKVVSDAIGKGFSLIRILLPPKLRHQLQVQIVICASDQVAIVGVPMTSSLGLINLIECLTELRETFHFLHYHLIKGCIVKEQQDEREA